MPGRASAPAESGSEKIVVNNKQLQDNMKSQQSKSTQNSDEETDKEELCSADKERQNDPQYAVNYVREIFDNLRESEVFRVLDFCSYDMYRKNVCLSTDILKTSKVM